MDVVRNDAENRFEIRRDGVLLGFADYVIRDQTIIFTHTQVFPEFGGQGVGTELVKESLDQVRAEGKYHVIPRCPFYRAFIEAHPEYADLLAGQADAQ